MIHLSLKPSFLSPWHRLQRRGRASHDWQKVRHAPKTRSSSVCDVGPDSVVNNERSARTFCKKVSGTFPPVLWSQDPKISLTLKKLSRYFCNHISLAFIRQMLVSEGKGHCCAGWFRPADVALEDFKGIYIPALSKGWCLNAKGLLSDSLPSIWHPLEGAGISIIYMVQCWVALPPTHTHLWHPPLWCGCAGGGSTSSNDNSSTT